MSAGLSVAGMVLLGHQARGLIPNTDRGKQMETTASTHTVECEYFTKHDELLGQVNTIRSEANYSLKIFKDSVRDSFIDFANDNDIDTDTANEFLEGLGLEGVETDFPVTAQFTYTIELTVKARNESEAQDKANNNLYVIAPDTIRIEDEDEDGITGGYANLDNYETV